MANRERGGPWEPRGQESKERPEKQVDGREDALKGTRGKINLGPLSGIPRVFLGDH